MKSPTVDRRRFLLGSGVLAALGVVGGVTTVTWEDLTSAAQERPRAIGEGVVVVVTMYGGNDGINTVIPYSDNAYHDSRPELAYAPQDVLHLDDHLGLNPAMTGLADAWTTGSLAIVRGVGYPEPDHSHFRSMDIWQTAQPQSAVHTGWIGRWLDTTGDDPLRAVCVGPVLPMLAIGETTTAAALNTSGHGLATSAVTALTALGSDQAGDSPAESMVCSSYRAEKTMTSTFGPLLSGAQKQHTSGPKGRGGSSLADQLATVATCVKAGVPTKVYSVSISGFDTHADERETQQRLLGQLDSALSAFLTEMAADPRGRDVVVMAYSEFGRRVKANASEGTDHGTAAPVLIAGAPVRGGFYGDEPSLTDLDDGDLKATTDFRDVYAELIDRGLGGDPTPAVGPGRKPVGFL